MSLSLGHHPKIHSLECVNVKLSNPKGSNSVNSKSQKCNLVKKLKKKIFIRLGGARCSKQCEKYTHVHSLSETLMTQCSAARALS